MCQLQTGPKLILGSSCSGCHLWAQNIIFGLFLSGCSMEHFFCCQMVKLNQLVTLLKFNAETSFGAHLVIFRCRIDLFTPTYRGRLWPDFREPGVAMWVWTSLLFPGPLLFANCGGRLGHKLFWNQAFFGGGGNTRSWEFVKTKSCRSSLALGSRILISHKKS